MDTDNSNLTECKNNKTWKTGDVEKAKLWGHKHWDRSKRKRQCWNFPRKYRSESISRICKPFFYTKDPCRLQRYWPDIFDRWGCKWFASTGLRRAGLTLTESKCIRNGHRTIFDLVWLDDPPVFGRFGSLEEIERFRCTRCCSFGFWKKNSGRERLWEKSINFE